MRRYETIVIVDPDLSEDDRNSLSTRVKDIFPQQNGTLIEEDIWGARKLAYPIMKKPRGFFARYDYCGMGPLVNELERTLRIDDRVLKFLTVQLEDEADVDQILADAAAAKAATEVSTPTEAPAKSEAPTPPTAAAPSESNDKAAEETAAKPAEETAAKPAEETAAKPAEEAAAEPTEESAAKPAEKAVAKPAEEAVDEPAEETAAEPTEETSEKE